MAQGVGGELGDHEREGFRRPGGRSRVQACDEGAGDFPRAGDTGGAVALHDRIVPSVSVVRRHPALDRLCRQAQRVPAWRGFSQQLHSLGCICGRTPCGGIEKNLSWRQ
jgi:hypothetical protein